MASQSITLHLGQGESRKLERLVRAEEAKAKALNRIANALHGTIEGKDDTDDGTPRTDGGEASSVDNGEGVPDTIS